MGDGKVEGWGMERRRGGEMGMEGWGRRDGRMKMEGWREGREAEEQGLASIQS